jgi:DNA-binding transcriptional MerR regulator
MFSLRSSEVEQGMSMRIQELAVRAGTTTRTLRYYEAQGLLPVDRSANGYRRYSELHVRLVREIRSLQAVGFSLEEVRPFVECLLTGHESGDECPASVDAYRSKVAFLDERIGQLEEARARLTGRLAEIGEPQCEMLAGLQRSDPGN